MQKQTNWIGVSVNHTPQILEEISAQIFNLGCQGITELEASFELYFSENDFSEKQKETLIGLLKSNKIELEDLTFTKVAHENWNENWKENFKIFGLGEKIIIQPDWENYQAKPDETVITIAPKMSFGTGHHETTRLILELMENLITPGMSVLDAGTGSAILAIYAALKAAKPVIAFDNDPEAIDNALENCLLNNVVTQVQVSCNDLSGIEKRKFDLILANINRNVLLTLSTPFLDYSAPGKLLILSGLLQTDFEDIKKKYTNAGWHLLDSKQEGEWMALMLKNEKA
jgi:ribosomal protein L11 methyltransferase